MSPPSYAPLEALRERVANAAVRAGRDPASIQILGITKTATVETLQMAWEGGLRSFGHNHVQALAKHHACLPEAEWHLVGPLQSNKARQALPLLQHLHTLTTARLAKRLHRGIEALPRPPLNILVQVNVAEDQRHGLPPLEVLPFLESLQILKHLRPRGLMTLAPQIADSTQLRNHFSKLRCLAEEALREGLLPSGPELSMGMSQDFEDAIAEGATLVRIGRAIFPVVPPLRP